MKIALGQIAPLKGNIPANIKKHLRQIEKAARLGAAVILFPELSLTGYEPTLAKDLAMTKDSSHLKIFQQLSKSHQLIIGVGAPIKMENKIHIGLFIFHPDDSLQIYTKQYLHPDELPFFTEGKNNSFLIKNTAIGLAICYELTLNTHFAQVKNEGGKIYLASVAKSEKGVVAAYDRLSFIAKQYKIPVLMVNCVGPADDFVATGQSAIWNEKGELTTQLGAQEENVLIGRVQHQI